MKSSDNATIKLSVTFYLIVLFSEVDACLMTGKNSAKISQSTWPKRQIPLPARKKKWSL